MQTQTPQSQWVVGLHAWAQFVSVHAELGYRPGHMNFHNFLRNARSELLRCDAIRRAKNRYWIAHVDRFPEVAFAIATGQTFSGDEK
jgi:hypothetical protein